MNNNTKIFSDFKKFAPLIPAPVFWLDTNGVMLGGNDLAFQGAGAMDRNTIIGKASHEFYPKSIADIITSNIK